MADKQIKQLTEETTTALDDRAVVQKNSNDDTVQVSLANLTPVNAITPEKLQSGTGTDWAWDDWTPTLTGFSGTPTVTAAKYKQTGKTVNFYIQVTGTSNNTEKFFTLPVAPAAWQDALFGGNAHTAQASNYVAGTLFDVSGSRLKVYRGFNQATATSMVTAWAASGTATFTLSMTYEAA